jgi:hypothetical protein
MQQTGFSTSRWANVEHKRERDPNDPPDFTVNDFVQNDNFRSLDIGNIVPPDAVGQLIHVKISLDQIPLLEHPGNFSFGKNKDGEGGELDYTKDTYPGYPIVINAESTFCICYAEGGFRRIAYAVWGNPGWTPLTQIDLTVLGWIIP